MKKLTSSLPFRLLIGVIVGIVVGLVANATVIQVILTIKELLGSLINFCVPLIIIGFIAPPEEQCLPDAGSGSGTGVQFFRVCGPHVHGSGLCHYPQPLHPVGG